MNILFVTDVYPGVGGIESVTTTLMDYLGEDANVYILSHVSRKYSSLATNIKGMYTVPFDDMPKVVEQYNRIISENSITHVINQGMFLFNNDMILNPERDKSVKILSVLHSKPGYEAVEVDNSLKAYTQGKPKNLKWRIFRYLGIAPLLVAQKRARTLKKFRDSYQRLAEEGNRIIVLTDAYRSEFIRLYQLEGYDDKIIAIPNTLPASWSSVTLEYCEEKCKEVLFVGRLEQEKRVERIIDVWSRLGNAGEWKLTIVGDGSKKIELEAQVKAHGLANVEFVGSSPTPELYYKRASMLLLTSDFEGFCMSLIESQRYGVVPVTFNMSAGTAHIVADGGGVLIENGNVEAMAETVDKLMIDSERLRDMHEQAYRRSSFWTIENIGMQWRKLLNEL